MMSAPRTSVRRETQFEPFRIFDLSGISSSTPTVELNSKYNRKGGSP